MQGGDPGNDAGAPDGALAGAAGDGGAASGGESGDSAGTGGSGGMVGGVDCGDEYLSPVTSDLPLHWRDAAATGSNEGATIDPAGSPPQLFANRNCLCAKLTAPPGGYGDVEFKLPESRLLKQLTLRAVIDGEGAPLALEHSDIEVFVRTGDYQAYAFHFDNDPERVAAAAGPGLTIQHAAFQHDGSYEPFPDEEVMSIGLQVKNGEKGQAIPDATLRFCMLAVAVE